MQRIFGAVLLLSVLLVTQILSYAEQPAVAGFIGVPWGASRAQVAAAMAKKGFTLIEQGADGVLDRYRGTFTDHPAELNFWYKKNIFHNGQALLDCQGQKPVAMSIYQQMVPLFEAKYGPPDTEGCGTECASSWNNIPTTATPPGKIWLLIATSPAFENMRGWTVQVVCGWTVQVVYSIGEGWALQKTDKDI